MPASPTSDLAKPLASTALFSECGRYRYLLTRTYPGGSGSCLVIMLNPSTADASIDDPTIRRCAGFVQSWGMAQLRVVNLFAFRSPDPKRLGQAKDPVGPDNDGVICREIRQSSLIVTAWGNYGAVRGRADQVRKLLRQAAAPVGYFGTNATGEPRHPLYLSAGSALSLYAPS